ncbi:MAG TPA: glycosyltransferase family 2 protein [Pirellulales bacterium]
MLKPSLSMILPVYNAQSTLRGLVELALEVLPDLTPRWELLVIDDGSTDATPEIANDLVRPWPQVSVIHHRKPLGRVGWQREGVEWSRGEILLLRDPDCQLDLGGLHKLWKRIVGQDVVVARESGRAISGRAGGRRALPFREPSLQMIRRRALLDWATSDGEEELGAFLTRRRITQHEVELLSRSALSAVPGNKVATRPEPPAPKSDQPQDHAAIRQPNYLTRLRAFALGE